MNNIKKYIKEQVSNYHVDVPLNYLKEHLKRYFEDYHLDFDPPYQRGYVWTDKQKKDYVEYMIRLGSDQTISGKQFYFNHPGWMRDWKGNMEIVDGKQRLSALLDWIDGKFGIFDEDIHYDKEHGRIVSGITLSFNIATMKSKKDVVDWYIAMNTGGTMHTSEDVQRAVDFKNSLS